METNRYSTNKDAKIVVHVKHQLMDVLNGKNWLDENFRDKLKGIDDSNAFCRPMEHMHSIAEIVAHLTVWRQASIDKLMGVPNDLTVESEDNWLSNDVLKEKGWNHVINAFMGTHEELLHILDGQNDSFLEREYQPGYRFGYLIEGIVHHDLYHLGQLGIILKYLDI